MFLLGDRLVTSPSDLRLAATCEFALVRTLDARLGRIAGLPVTDDAMLARVAELGTQHEQRELLRLSARHPGRVLQFPRPAYTLEGLTTAHETTLATLRGDSADVVVQATFFDGGFVGHSDFLERTDDGWLVMDAKLARSESVPALLQIGAYAACLTEAGIPTAPIARLVLGTGEPSDHPLDDLLPVHRARRARLAAVMEAHAADDGPALWRDDRWLACGRCEVCVAAAEETRDVLLVAGVRMPTRRRLLEAGVHTVEDLAARTEPVPEVRAATFERLVAQARLQVEQDGDPTGRVRSEVVSTAALATIPEPSAGDVFFDFEGDPLWAERGSSDWGLEYLFGLIEIDTGTPEFRTFWAHDREAEKQALIDFVTYVQQRRRQWPTMHVHHYANYEVVALLRLAVRHGVCEEEIDQFLREGVFVDLYAVVRAGVRVSQRSYSIKKLEPLYMDKRAIALQSGGDSITVYHEFCAARDRGDEAEAHRLLELIHDYNRDDCLSTLGLRDWLVQQREASPVVEPASDDVGEGAPAGPVTLSADRQARIALEQALRELIADTKPHERTAEQQAIALAAAAVQFHAREDKPFWWRHFGRLRTPVADWPADSGVFVVQEATVVTDWHRQSSRQKPRRILRLVGEPLSGTLLTPRDEVNAVYAAPGPAGIPVERGFHHGKSPAGVRILEASPALTTGGHVRQELVVEELMPTGGEEHAPIPAGLVPGGLVRVDNIDAAITDFAAELHAQWPAVPARAGADLLLRRPPRFRRGTTLPVAAEGDQVATITAALLDLDNSYLAVQGPPGTGKTHVASHVIAALVQHGWRIGVCAQSHAAIENVLAAVIRAGVPAGQVAKRTVEAEHPAWTDLAQADDLAAFARDHEGGYVIGGTAWDLTNPKRVERDQLDLVVVDEAGQFSLAKTMAVAMAGARLLLLGDPQQLPQVSQGSHPDPVDLSALGWLIGEEPVLDPEHGYFLATTWRMHPALTAPVSRLSYAGQLHSQVSVTQSRSLDGVEPGLHVRSVDHHDNRSSSPEEAAAVVDLVRDMIGRRWIPAVEDGEPERAIGPQDVIITTPYNAQVATIRAALDAAGFDEVPVGTVDKFQGREAPVAIVSMAASSPSDVSRGIDFLLDRNRLNVAISRAKHAAYLVRSPLLTDLAPRSPRELVALGAFIGLCERAVSTT